MENFTLNVAQVTCQRDENILFDKLSFEVGKGELLLLEGRNGAGKTTLLHILSGLRTPDEGDVYFNGKRIHSMDSDYFEHISYLGHLNGLKPELTARENLQLSLALGHGSGMDIEQALDFVRLSGYEDVLTKKFSAGMKRRTALARLLVLDSALWILDEPYTSLDVYGIKKIEQMLVNHIQQGGSVIMTSHHPVQLDQVPLKRLNLSEQPCH